MRKIAALAFATVGFAFGADDNSFFLKGATIHTMAGKISTTGRFLSAMAKS